MPSLPLPGLSSPLYSPCLSLGRLCQRSSRTVPVSLPCDGPHGGGQLPSPFWGGGGGGVSAGGRSGCTHRWSDLKSLHRLCQAAGETCWGARDRRSFAVTNAAAAPWHPSRTGAGAQRTKLFPTLCQTKGGGGLGTLVHAAHDIQLWPDNNCIAHRTKKRTAIRIVWTSEPSSAPLHNSLPTLDSVLSERSGPVQGGGGGQGVVRGLFRRENFRGAHPQAYYTPLWRVLRAACCRWLVLEVQRRRPATCPHAP